MVKARLRLSVAAVLALAAMATGLGRAEQQRGRQAAPPRDVARPRSQVTPIAPRLRLTAERAQAFVDAAVRRLDYLPPPAPPAPTTPPFNPPGPDPSPKQP